MVMWQVWMGRALKAWNNQLLGPARGTAVHALLPNKQNRQNKTERCF